MDQTPTALCDLHYAHLPLQDRMNICAARITAALTIKPSTSDQIGQTQWIRHMRDELVRLSYIALCALESRTKKARQCYPTVQNMTARLFNLGKRASGPVKFPKIVASAIVERRESVSLSEASKWRPMSLSLESTAYQRYHDDDGVLHDLSDGVPLGPEGTHWWLQSTCFV